MRSSCSIHATRGAGPAWARCALALTLFLGACSESAAPPGPAVQPVEPVGDLAIDEVGAQATPYGSEYSWSQGQPATNLGGNKGLFGIPRVCYLTRVTGKFTGSSESVSIFLFGNTWILYGASSSVGVGARARCMLVASYSSQYSWASGTGGLKITNPSLVACFITGIGGEFYKSDWVYLMRYPNTANWALGGNGSDGNTSQIQVRARCAKTVQGNNADVATGSWNGGSSTNLAPNSGTVCVLTEVGGSLQSASSYLAIYKHASSWLMLGSPANAPNKPSGKSHCYS